MTNSKDVSDEMLMALADNELPNDEAKELHDLIARDSALAARYSVFTQSRKLLEGAFPTEPVPDRLIATILNTRAEPINMHPTVASPRRRAIPQVQWGLAIAASFLLTVGSFWAGRGSAPEAQRVNPETIAVALANTATGDEVTLPDGSIARVLGSYGTDLGLCRLIGHVDQRHVVCREDTRGTWTTALSVAWEETGSFLPASDLAGGLIDRLLDDLGAGPALTPTEEQQRLQQ